MGSASRRLAAALAAAFALAGCGSDTEQHGPGEAEHSREQPGMTTPHVAEHGAEGGHGEEIGGSHGEAARGPGASDEHDLALDLEPASLRTGETGEIAFRVLDAAGDPVKRFRVEHTKQMHLIVVSKDLLHFHHVHPRVGRDGRWRARLRPEAPGDYRVVADVNHAGRRMAVTADVEIGGAPTATGQPAQEARFVRQELEAGVPTTLEFKAPDRTEPYLGAAGHLVILRKGDLEYLHVHPRDRELAFEASFRKAGRYVMFLEYKRAGEIQLARFEVTVP